MATFAVETLDPQETFMGRPPVRICKEIEVEGRKLDALFDSGAVYSYLRREFRPASTQAIPPRTVGLGGGERRIDEGCFVNAKIDGLDFDLTAYIVDDLPEIECGQLDAIIGALVMEAWWIRLDPATGELDLTMLRKREFTEL